MEELQKALILKRKYNKMPFDEFYKEFKAYFKIEIPKEDLEQWQFAGLNNTDFLSIYGI